MKKVFDFIKILKSSKRQLFQLIIIFYTLLSNYVSIAQNITRPNIVGPSGLQVNSYTGNLFYQRTDMFVPGRGISMDISFTYNSSERATDLGYGFGWTFNYNRFYSANDTGITFYSGDGRKDEYKISGANYIAPKGIFDAVTNYSTGKFRLITKEGIQYYFDDASHKKLTSIVDRNNNQVTLNYTGNNLTSITDASSRTITLSWVTNRLTEMNTNFNGSNKKVQYFYDPAGTLKSVKDPMGNSIVYTYIRGNLMGTLTDGNGNTTNIVFNNNNAVTRFISCESEKRISYNTSEVKTYVSDINNDKTFLTTYSFNGDGNLINKAGNCCGYNTSYSYDEDKNVNQFKDANGNTSIYTYDARGNLLSQTDPLGQTIFYTYENIFNQITSITDKRGNKTGYSYDNKGNLLQIKQPLNVITSYSYENNGDLKDITDPKGNITKLTHDVYGYIATITDANTGVITFTHDVWGNRLSQKDANNHTTNYVYDAVNRISRITDASGHTTKYTYDANGNILTSTDGLNNTTSYVYDSRNEPISVTDALNHISYVQYDAVGNMIAFTDANGNKTNYTYDKQSRRTSMINAIGDITFYGYDGIGNRTNITFPNGNTILIKYDAINRATEITDKLGTLITYQYDASNNRIAEADAKGNTISYLYDALNRLVSKTDPLGNAYVYSYDATGNMVNKKDRNGNSTSYQYDVLNRRIKTTDALGFNTNFAFDAVGNLLSVTDANGNATLYTYDALNRSIEERFADNTTKAYTYDADGNLLTRKDNNGKVTNYIYGKLNRLVVKSYPGGADTLAYDATGHLIKAKNNEATVLFTYDKAYRILNENLNGKETKYSYNVAANIKTITYPGGRIIERKLDERKQLKAINENGGIVASFNYNNAGENTRRKYANGTETNLQYNANKQLSSISANPNHFVDFSYTYDKEENPLAAAFGHRPANSEQYKYDAKNQLIEYNKGSTQQTIYNYDGLGNRKTTEENGITSKYTSNNINAYTTITKENNSINYTYDANGNMLTEGATKYTYDIENRLITVDGGTTSSYTYDALGRRIKKIAGANTINYYFDGLQVIEERDALDTLKANYTWGTWLDDIVLMKRNNKAYYYQTNSIGSIVAITDSLGTLKERYEYDAFGKPYYYDANYSLQTQSIVGNNYTFTGREYESETQNFYYRVRNYNPRNGHFLQKDPLGYFSGINEYAYVSNHPVKLLDPLGLFGSPPFCSRNDLPGKPYDPDLPFPLANDQGLPSPSPHPTPTNPFNDGFGKPELQFQLGAYVSGNSEGWGVSYYEGLGGGINFDKDGKPTIQFGVGVGGKLPTSAEGYNPFGFNISGYLGAHPGIGAQVNYFGFGGGIFIPYNPGINYTPVPAGLYPMAPSQPQHNPQFYRF